MQQWMIGLGIMVAVSNCQNILGGPTDNTFSNGRDMGAPSAVELSPGASHSPSRSSPQSFSPVVLGFSPNHRDGSLEKAERVKAALFSPDFT